MIAICLATYNGARFLDAQLRSIAVQSHGGWHLYARDDGSSDDTVARLHAFAAAHPGRVTVLDDGLGRLGARGNFNRLMAVAGGDYIAFADQDDVWRPDKLACALAAMQRIEAGQGTHVPALVHADRRLVDADGVEITPSYWRSRGLEAGRFDFGTCLTFCLAAGGATLVNRALLDRALPVPEAARMYDCWLELVAHAFGTVVALDEIALDHRRHGANTSGAHGDIDSTAARRLWRRAGRLVKGWERQRAISRGFLAQAQAFQNRFGADLPPEIARRLARFTALPEQHLPGRLLALRQSRAGLARALVFAAVAHGRPQDAP